ncbi:hypothetical protein Q1M63_28975 [Sinorhizobium meliloti]|nr:hypothetical protein Q1M63_28975 [Sinorhizobium meliloti]
MKLKYQETFAASLLTGAHPGRSLAFQAATTAVFDAVTREERELLDAVSLPPVLHP